MKYCATANMSALPSASHGDHAEVESLLQSWQGEMLLSKLPNHPVPISPHLIQAEPLSPENSEDTKSGLEVLDHLIMNSQMPNSSLAELKPLPPFTGYTGHLSINGISGHHFHAIAQRLPEENNNNYPSQSSYGSEQNIVSSSTCLPDSNAVEESKVFPVNHDNETKMYSQSSENTDSKLFLNSSVDSCGSMHADSPGVKMYGNPDSCGELNPGAVITTKTESMYDISSIEDIAAIIGSAIADTTVPSTQVDDPEHSESRDSWMDLDAWFEGTCTQPQESKTIISPDNLSEFVLPHSPQQLAEFANKMEYHKNGGHEAHGKCHEYMQRSVGHGGSTLQTLLSHNYMPMLAHRLQNGPPVKQEVPSSTSYGMDVISTSSPPGNVVSTTDNMRFIQHHYAIGIKPEGLCSPDHMMGNYPHTTTTTPMSNKSKRSRAQKKQQQQAVSHSIAFQNASDLTGLLGKEKPVHRCTICNRGFLNKSNIKVHLRTHTGEKPFRCEVCSKAFRQKAHLIKHQQIHKRIGRD